MTVRRRTSTGRSPESIAACIPSRLHQAPAPRAGLTSDALLAEYRGYSAELAEAVWRESRRDDWGLVVAVAAALGTDLSSWYRRVFA